MKKFYLLFILIILFSSDSWGQEYRVEFDIDFFWTRKKGRFYINDARIITTSGYELKLDDFIRNSMPNGILHKIRGVYTYNNSKGPVKYLKIETKRNRRSSTTCGPYKYDIYLNNDNSNCFNLAGQYISWGCIDSSLDRDKHRVHKLECYPVVNISVPDKKVIAQDEKFMMDASSGFPSSVYKWRWSSDPPTSSTSGNPVPTSCFSDGKFEATGEQLLGTDFGAMIGKPVYIWIDLGCDKRSEVIDIDVKANTPKLVSVVGGKVKCPGESNGRIRVIVDRPFNGENEKVEFFAYITGSNKYKRDYEKIDDTTYDIIGLPEGEYTVEIASTFNGVSTNTTDAYHKRTGIKVVDPAPISYTIDETQTKHISCKNGNDGSFTITVKGGTAPYTLYWKSEDSDNFNQVTGNKLTVSGLKTGNYMYYVTDVNNCELEDLEHGGILYKSIALFEPAKILSGVFIPEKTAEPSGNNRKDGYITASLEGGTPPYKIIWKEKTSGKTITTVNNSVEGESKLHTLPAGTYILNVTDSKGCMLSPLQITLSEPNEVMVEIDQTGTIACYGDTNVGLTASASGGLGGPYTYKWYKAEAGEFKQISSSATIQEQGAGTYMISVADNSTPPNIKEVEYIISQPDELKASATHKNASCKGTSSGTITVSINGGIPPYELFYKESKENEYSKKAISLNSCEVSNLKAGEYDYYVVDANNCSAKIGNTFNGKVIISEPNVALEVVSTDLGLPSGAGRADGSITVKIDGGVPYSSGNKYIVKWTKADGTVLESEISLDESGVFVSKVTALETGVYSLEIQDDNSERCTINGSFNLSEPLPLKVALVQTKQVSCFGNLTGQLVAHASGGVSYFSGNPYKYQWYKIENGATSMIENENDSILDKVGAGVYKVKIEDASKPVNTITSEVVNISQPSLLATTVLSTQHVSCPNGTDGEFHISVKGGAGSYKLFYKHIANQTEYNVLTISTGNIFYLVNLSGGTYSIYIEDANGCKAPILGQDIAEIVIQAPGKPISIVSQQINIPTGTGRSDGSIFITVDGGTPYESANKYIVSWKDDKDNTITPKNKLNGDGLFTSQIDGLPKGVYTIEIKDKNYEDVPNGCYFKASINLQDPLPLTVILENTKTIDCFGNNSGELVAHVNGGIPYISDFPYKYSWYKVEENGAETLFSSVNDSILANVSVGTYKVKIADGSLVTNTVESSSITVTQPEEMLTNIETKMISCHNGSNGYIRISVSGGTGKHKLFYKENRTDADYKEVEGNSKNSFFELNSLRAGKYSLYIVDENKCYARVHDEDIAIITLSEPDKALTISRDTVYVPTKKGAANGEISIRVEGGTPDYSVIWSDEKGDVLAADQSYIEGAFTSVLKGLKGGRYSVLIRDANYSDADALNNTACIVAKEYEVTEPDELVLSLEETHYVSCYQMADAEITAHTKGGVRNKDKDQLPYKYVWYKQEGQTFVVLPNQKDSILKNISEGVYKLDLEDYSREPNKVSSIYKISQPEILKALVEDVHIVCGQVATVSVEVMGGTMPYEYKWNTGDNTAEVKNLNAGKYMVIVTDARGCEVSAIVRVTTPSDLFIDGKINNPVCYDSTNGSIITQVTGGTGPYTYEWNTGATTKDLLNIGAGVYTIVVTDQDGCSFSESFELKNPKPVEVDLGEDKILCIGQSYMLEPKVEDPNATFYWTGPSGFTSKESKVELTRAGNYRLVITDSKGCQATDDIKISMTDYGISAEMVVATDVFVNDTIVLVNISSPEPERIEWIFDKDDPITVLETTPEIAKIIFKTTGNYSVGMRSFVKDCYQDVIKTLRVTESDGGGGDNFGKTDIHEFVTYPNPNDGIFKVKVELGKESTIRLRLFSLGKGGLIDDRTLSGAKSYDEQYQKNLTPGVYVLLLETTSGRKSQKILVR